MIECSRKSVQNGAQFMRFIAFLMICIAAYLPMSFGLSVLSNRVMS